MYFGGASNAPGFDLQAANLRTRAHLLAGEQPAVFASTQTSNSLIALKCWLNLFLGAWLIASPLAVARWLLDEQGAHEDELLDLGKRPVKAGES